MGPSHSLRRDLLAALYRTINSSSRKRMAIHGITFAACWELYRSRQVTRQLCGLKHVGHHIPNAVDCLFET